MKTAENALSQDSDDLCAVVQAVMNVPVTSESGNFLTEELSVFQELP